MASPPSTDKRHPIFARVYAGIDQLLERQFDNPTAGQNRILQVSDGFSHTWSASAPTGSKVDPSSILLNGTPLDPNGSYRIMLNSLLAEGGDNFTVLAQGTNRLGGAVDLDALVEYFAANSPVPPGPRIASPWRPSSISWIRPANGRNTPSTNG